MIAIYNNAIFYVEIKLDNHKFTNNFSSEFFSGAAGAIFIFFDVVEKIETMLISFSSKSFSPVWVFNQKIFAGLLSSKIFGTSL